MQATQQILLHAPKRPLYSHNCQKHWSLYWVIILTTIYGC